MRRKCVCCGFYLTPQIEGENCVECEDKILIERLKREEQDEDIYDDPIEDDCRE